MKRIFIYLLLCFPFLANSANNRGRTVINLNGTWQFDQTVNAFPPAKFTRTIPVPGLVHLAEPKIEDYDKFFKRADKVVAKEKEHYLPGIWDDVLVSFTGKVRINRMLVLPSVAGKKVAVKTQIRNLSPAQIFYGDAVIDSVTLD